MQVASEFQHAMLERLQAHTAGVPLRLVAPPLVPLPKTTAKSV